MPRVKERTLRSPSGRKWVMVFAICVFLLGSILCGAAQDMNWLIAARVVQGLGGGGCLALASVIISDITTLRERPKFLAMGAFAWALGTNIGVSYTQTLLKAH
jgi:MFS family permease